MEAWKKPIRPRENEIWKTMIEFCKRTACFGWYTPLFSVLEKDPRWGQYPDSMQIIEDEGSIRLALAAWNGCYEGSIKICSPSIAPIKNNPERCFRHLIASFCKKGPFPARDLEFIVTHGTTPWAWANHTLEKSGFPCRLKGLPENPLSRKLIEMGMPEYDPEGSIFWTPIGAYCSSLDFQAPQWDVFGEYPWAVGLYYSKVGFSIDHKLVMSEVEDLITLFYEKLYEPWLLPQEKKKGRYIQPSEIKRDEIDVSQLEYYAQMADGFASQVFLAEEYHQDGGQNSPPRDILPINPLEGDGYMSDQSLGDLFG
jgi:hypothetical protein